MVVSPLPQPPDWSLDWEGILAESDWLRDLDGCAQDPKWREEGDALVHTRMVYRQFQNQYQ